MAGWNNQWWRHQSDTSHSKPFWEGVLTDFMFVPQIPWRGCSFCIFNGVFVHSSCYWTYHLEHRPPWNSGGEVGPCRFKMLLASCTHVQEILMCLDERLVLQKEQQDIFTLHSKIRFSIRWWWVNWLRNEWQSYERSVLLNRSSHTISIVSLMIKWWDGFNITSTYAAWWCSSGAVHSEFDHIVAKPS